MNLHNLILLASDVATDGASNQTPLQSFGAMAIQIVPIILLVVAFYFFLIRPQKKQQKETEQMRSSIEVGDQVTTIGGIIGTVRQIKDDGEIYVIETGANNDRLTVHKWAIQSKDTISE